MLAATTIPAAAAAAVVGAGTVHCTATGTVRFSPKLTATPTAKTKIVVSAKLTCTGGTGSSAVTVTGGKLTAKTTPATASCTTTNFGPGTVTVNWKASGGSLKSSKLTLASATAADGSNIVLDLNGPGAPGTGSYFAEDTKLHVVGDTVAGGMCGGANRGFKFTGAGGTSTFDVKPANPNNLPVDHIVVLMQENRSADHYLGQLNGQGQPAYEPEPNTGNPDPTNLSGPPIVPFHKTSLCEVADLDHSWNGTHAEINGGAMDGFTAANVNGADPNGSRTMGYYDQTDLPYYYALDNTFATGDRYFASAPTQTYPNRLYLLAGTSFGHIRNDFGNSTQRSVFQLLDEHSITWRIYSSQYPISYGGMFFKYVQDRASAHISNMARYFTDAANGTLPDVSFIDPDLFDPTGQNDEHPPANVQIGQRFVADVANALMASPNWSTSAMFFTYDEHGGFYDHVPPPAAVPPDGIAPLLQGGDTPGAFNIYGIRVPATVISPYSKSHFVSHVVNDHTSILSFLEYRFGLPPLTARDAAANPMLEFFDFSSPAFGTPPSIPAPSVGTC